MQQIKTEVEPKLCEWGVTRDHAAGCEEEAAEGKDYCQPHEDLSDYLEKQAAAYEAYLEAGGQD